MCSHELTNSHIISYYVRGQEKCNYLTTFFIRSGSIAEAAIKTGRKAIGIEINPNYVNIAVQRVKNIRYEEENQVKQGSLFDLVTDIF